MTTDPAKRDNERCWRDDLLLNRISEKKNKMFGTKIRSWMETHIVRPRKKQHRKDASSKKNLETEIIKDFTEPLQTALAETHISSSVVNGGALKAVGSSEQVQAQYQRQHNSNNLSSPESAYSTGYSTDGTSPGASFPAVTTAPEYYINIRTGTRYFHSSSSDVPLRLSLPGASTGSDVGSCQTQQATSSTSNTSVVEVVNATNVNATPVCVPSPALTSPRQRNRIRTNPWVSTNNSACNCSPLHVAIARQSILAQTQSPSPGVRTAILAATASPVRRKWSCPDKKRCMKCGACARFEAFSSSSSSSLSVNSVHRAVTSVPGVRPPAAAVSVLSDEEDDRTLNEMMGKYDESYIYEKETDILSDSDPTDCDEDYDDTDADAGREGGDERDPLTDEDDFDFIDNGSLELNMADNGSNSFVNMGHCTYHSFLDEPSIRRRRAPSDTPTSSRRRKPSERRMRHASSKKRRDRLPLAMLPALLPLQARVLGSGCMDGSRSAGATPVSVRRRRAAELADPALLARSVAIAVGADQKRRNSMSYARPTPRPNFIKADTKLIELDKEADKKYRELIIEAEHILMAMRTTSSPPVSGSPARRPNVGPANKRVELLRNEECGSNNVNNSPTNSNPVDAFSPTRKYISNVINNNAPLPVSKLAVTGMRWPPRPNLQRHCPQSEPVKRKVYAHAAPAADAALPVLAAAANNGASPVFHRQKLFHTITSLKKNLESQSETLRHTYYGSSQRL